MSVGFLFDNDGVLIDSSSLHWRAWKLLIEEENQHFHMDHEMFVKGFGKRNDLILRDAVPGSTELQRKKWAERKEELFRKIARAEIQLLPGMESFLKEVKKKGIPRIIASSTPIENLKMFLSATVLGKYFDAFVSAEEVENGKPAPDVFLEGAKRLGLDPRKCIVLEDAPAGLEAGRAAGCFVIALATTHTKEELSDYDLIYGSAKELHLPEILSAFRRWQ